MRKIVLPGEFLGEKKGRKVGRWVYVEGDKAFAKVLGIPEITENEISLIPLSGVYYPSVGDRVIGVVISVEVSGWLVDINSPYVAFLPLTEAVSEFVDVYRTDLSRYYDIGDVIFCRISKVTKNKLVQVSMRDLVSRIDQGNKQEREC